MQTHRPAGHPSASRRDHFWVNQDPWQQYHNSSAQAAGIPDRPFPYSMANSPEQAQPFASQSSNQGFSQVIPPPPGFQNVNPQMIPIPVNTPQKSAQEIGGQNDENPFKRSERWMPPVPTPSFQDWKSRPAEIVGFIEWVTSLASWTGLGSNAYPAEILSALRESEPLGWHRLTASQVTRSVRLMSILKLCFENSVKASSVIRNYEEGKGFQRCCGFECLRLLAKEYAVKTRTELLFFRSQLANASITGKTIPEAVRKVQSELYQFERVSQLVDPAVNVRGLEFQEADKVLLLLRSLPSQCRQWVVLHAKDESFNTYLEAALRYESQQRIWSELNGQPIAALGDQKGQSVPKGKKGKGKEKKGGKDGKTQENSEKGKGIGNGSESRTCFQCNQRGHLAADCPNKSPFKSKGDSNSKGSNKSDGKGKKGFEKGKKGSPSDKGKSKGGKPKGQRATEFQQQPESEVGSEWSEPDVEDGGRLSTFNEQDVAQPFFICQNMQSADPYLWLVDSGASRTVVSLDSLSAYKVLRERTLATPIQFRTASGEQVQIDHECMLEVSFPTTIEHDECDRNKLVKYEIRAVVGPVEHNLLSVCSLTKLGATFVFGPDQCHIRVIDIRRLDCEIWANVPWIRAQQRKPRGRDQDVEMKGKLTMDTWTSEDLDDHESRKRALSAWFNNKPLSETAKDESSDGQTPSSSHGKSPKVSFFVSATQSKGSMSQGMSSGHVKVLKFEDHPEIKTFEVEPKANTNEPNHRVTSQDHGFLNAADHPLPAPGDLEDAIERPHDGKEPCPPSEVTRYPEFSKKVDRELSLHRRRGHIPFDSRCVHCIKSRSTLHHGRVSKSSSTPVDHHMMLIQADFFFLEGNKFILLVDAGTGLLGISLCGPNQDQMLADCRQYFRQLGISDQSSQTVEVLTDSEALIGQLLRRLGLPLQVKSAAPQAHESIGLAERNVRRVKEMTGCLRSDLRLHGDWFSMSPKRTTTLVLEVR